MMKKIPLFLLLLLIGVLPQILLAQGNFATSLHKTRMGKYTAYSAQNGGMELITGIPMDSLACIKCHALTYANGDTINPATYTPTCDDCHDFTQGTTVAEHTCLGCHNRQKYERQMMGTDTLDVHNNYGLVCTDCHSEAEIHGDDGIQHSSLLDPGAILVSCTDCHPNPGSNTYHNTHMNTVECSACHTKSMIACASCHFETLLATGKNRANTKLKGFEFLIKRNGKVATATYMSHTYNGQTNYIIAPNHAHFIMKNAKTCADCHYNLGNAVPAIEEYNNTGKMTIATWDSASKKIIGPQGIIPVTPDYKTAFQLDYATYTGDPNVFPSDPTKWVYLKSTTDNAHIFKAEPLDTTTMVKLGFTRIPTNIPASGTEIVPSNFVLKQNYPNPFNPGTTIEFTLAGNENINLSIFDLNGRLIKTLIENEHYAAGNHKVQWNGTDKSGRKVSSGIYFYRLKAGSKEKTARMLLMK